MTCPNCSFTRDRFLVSIDDIRDTPLAVAQDVVKLRIDAQLSLECPSCGVTVAEAVASQDVEMVPEWPAGVHQDELDAAGRGIGRSSA